MRQEARAIYRIGGSTTSIEETLEGQRHCAESRPRVSSACRSAEPVGRGAKRKRRDPPTPFAIERRLCTCAASGQLSDAYQ